MKSPPHPTPAPAQHVDAQHTALQIPPRPARNRPPGDDAKRLTRVQQALELRIAGATYRQIAVQLAVNERTAYYDVQTALGTLDAVVKQKVERLRISKPVGSICSPRVWRRIRAGDPRAVMATVRVMEHRAKLFSLDAPTKLAGPDGEPMSIRIVHQQLPE